MESTSFYIIQKHSLSVNGFTKFATSTRQSCFCSYFIFSTSVIASTETSVHFCFFFFVHLSFSLLLTLTLSVFWRSQHGTSTKAPLWSSVQLINQHLFFFLFHFFSLPFTCPLWLSLFLFTLFYLLSLHTPFPFFSLSCHSTSLPLFFRLFLLFTFRQVPGQLHGRRQGWFHERKPSQRYENHHPAQKVHSTHPDHVSTGEEAQIGVASPDGGRRRPGQQTCWGRSRRSAVPWVRPSF